MEQARERRVLWLFLGVAGVIRLVSMLCSVNAGGDAAARSLIAADWAEHPMLILGPNPLTWVWPPFPFYLNGVALWLWDDPLLVPRLISFLAALAALPLLYYSAAQLFDRRAALIGTCVLAAFSLHVKHGNIASSESLFTLCVLLTIATYCAYQRTRKAWALVLLALSLLIAAMTRFEAWALPGLLFLFLLVRARPLRGRWLVSMLVAVAVGLPAVAFILRWIYGSYVDFGDPLYSVHVAATEHVESLAASRAQLGQARLLLYNLLFWPGVLLLGLSPLACLAALWGLVLALRRRVGIEWIVTAALWMGVYVFQTVVAQQQFPLARYATTIGAVLCLYAGPGIVDLVDRIRSRAPSAAVPVAAIVLVAMLVSTTLLCFGTRETENPWLAKLASVSPVTRYPRALDGIIAWLRGNVGRDQSVIFDLADSDSAVIVPLYARLSRRQRPNVEGEDLGALVRHVERAPPDYLVLEAGGQLLRSRTGDPLVLGSRRFAHVADVGDHRVYRLAR